MKKLMATLLALFSVANLLSCVWTPGSAQSSRSATHEEKAEPSVAQVLAAAPEGKSVVNVALISGEGTAIDDGVLRELNDSQSLFEYRAVPYAQEDIQRFETELALGLAPDLVLFSDNIDTASPLFDDLYPYIDADSQLKRTGFLPHFLEALSDGGELKQLWDQTWIGTVVARSSDVGDGRGLSPADYNRIAEENDRYASVFQSYMNGKELLKRVAALGIASCVDKEKGTCNFATSAFRDLLAWTKTVGPEFIESTDEDEVREADRVVLMPALIRQVANVTLRDSVFGEKGVYVGYPNGADGYSYYCRNTETGLSMAIPAASANKAGAWAFIRHRLSLDKQMEAGGEGLPVLREAAEKLAAQELDRAGRTAYEQLLDRTRYAMSYADEDLRQLITDCAQTYLTDGKTVAETVNLIQSKAGIYIAQRYGRPALGSV